MGGALKKVAGAVGKPFGLGGEQGDYFAPSNLAYSRMKSRLAANESTEMQEALAGYATGKHSLNDMISNAGTMMNDTGFKADALMNMMAIDPRTASRMAEEQVLGSQIGGQLFGSEGVLGNAIGREQELIDTGFTLGEDEHSAYGQMAGNVARQFGQQESNLANMLQSRGLSGAPTAQAAFTSVLGNKNEQLQKAQRNIAQDKINTTLQRLGQTRSQINSLGQMGLGATHDQFGRNLAGVQQKDAQLGQMAGQETTQNKLHAASVADKRASKGLTILDAAGQGAYKGVAGGTEKFVGGLFSPGAPGAGGAGG